VHTLQEVIESIPEPPALRRVEGDVLDGRQHVPCAVQEGAGWTQLLRDEAIDDDSIPEERNGCPIPERSSVPESQCDVEPGRLQENAGKLAEQVPGVHISPGAFALVAMAATFGAATRAPFASIVFLFELTRDYNAILPLMLATVVADLVAGALMRDSIMTEKLTRRGLRVPSDYHADALLTTSVGAVMTPKVEVVPVNAPIADVAARFRADGHGAYPVVDGDGRCVGIVARGDLLREGDWTDESPVGDVAARDVVSVSSTDAVSEALERMLEEQIEHLPVIDSGQLVGMCTRTDVMRARRSQWSQEQAEPGWRPRRRRPQ